MFDLISQIFMGIEGYMLPCMSKQLFGLECPGCGFQRAVVFLLKGDLTASFKMYPGLFPMIFLFAFLLLNQFREIRNASKIIIGLASVTVIFILTNFILNLIY